MKRKPFIAGVCPDADFVRLQELVTDPEPNTTKGCVDPRVFYSILMTISKSSGKNPSHSHGDELINQARYLIDKSIEHPNASVLEIADHLQVNRCAFSRAFKLLTGISPKEYLTSRRISKAVELLRNTNLPVSEISIQCGFTEANYFSKFFRKYMNESPLGFRERNSP